MANPSPSSPSRHHPKPATRHWCPRLTVETIEACSIPVSLSNVPLLTLHERIHGAHAVLVRRTFLNHIERCNAIVDNYADLVAGAVLTRKHCHTQTITRVSASRNSGDVLTLEFDVARKRRQLTRAERPLPWDVCRGRGPVSRE